MGQDTTADQDIDTSLERVIRRPIERWRRWWAIAVTGTVDQQDVIEKRREEAYTSPRYLFMIAMSAGIAILGLLLSSPAVVIGAMLIAPLMGPIIGAGFAFAIGDFRWLRGCARALVAGTLIGIALTALIVFVSPLQTVTPEIASRTRPNLFDLAVALFSSMAGAYSLIRGREGTIVGVAIATALMPPLATVGFGLATLNWTVFSGALLLYVTNLMTIALTATVMARLYGFSARLSDTQTNWQTAIIVAVFVGLAIPLFFSLRQIVLETGAARQIRSDVMTSFDPSARLSDVEIDWASNPIAVDVTVLTPRLVADAEARTRQVIEDHLDQPVAFTLNQYEVGTSATAAEEAQLVAARQQRESDARQDAQALARSLALVAGAQPEDVVLDRDNRRAVVRAARIEGANMAAYRAIEARFAAGEPDWTIRIQPPPVALPPIPFENGEPTEAGRAALATLVWAARRTGLDVELVGGQPATRARAIELLAEDGVNATPVVGGAVMQPRWVLPAPPPAEPAT